MSFLSANIFLLHLTKTKLEMSIFTAVILINNYNHPFPSYILYIQITKENTKNWFQRTKHLLVKLDSANAFVIITFSFVSESFIFSIDKYWLMVLNCMRIYNVSTIWGSLNILSYIEVNSYYVYYMVLSARKLPREKTHPLLGEEIRSLVAVTQSNA